MKVIKTTKKILTFFEICQIQAGSGSGSRILKTSSGSGAKLFGSATLVVMTNDRIFSEMKITKLGDEPQLLDKENRETKYNMEQSSLKL